MKRTYSFPEYSFVCEAKSYEDADKQLQKHLTDLKKEEKKNLAVNKKEND